jgi:hypothetical protein
MTWFKVDDSLHGHPKLVELESGPRFAEAIALWTIAGSWCAHHLTDGRVPTAALRKLVPFPAAKAAAELVRVGLWTEADGGYQFHGWSDYQPTKERVEADRAANAGRLAKWRSKNAQSNALQTGVVTPLQTLPAVTPLQTVPPTRPDPIQERERARPPEAEPPPTTAGLVRIAYSELWSGANAACWPPSQATEDQLRPMVAWIESTATRERLTAQAVVDRLIRNWAADPWAKQHRYPWATFAKQYANHWQAGPAPASTAAPRGPVTVY